MKYIGTTNNAAEAARRNADALSVYGSFFSYTFSAFSDPARPYGFCPTGKGGGKDNSCDTSKGGGVGKAIKTPKDVADVYNTAAGQDSKTVNAAIETVKGMSKSAAKETFEKMGFKVSPAWTGQEIKARIAETIQSRQGATAKNARINRNPFDVPPELRGPKGTKTTPTGAAQTGVSGRTAKPDAKAPAAKAPAAKKPAAKKVPNVKIKAAAATVAKINAKVTAAKVKLDGLKAQLKTAKADLKTAKASVVKKVAANAKARVKVKPEAIKKTLDIYEKAGVPDAVDYKTIDNHLQELGSLRKGELMQVAAAVDLTMPPATPKKKLMEQLSMWIKNRKENVERTKLR